jgi:hypothetical protein
MSRPRSRPAAVAAMVVAVFLLVSPSIAAADTTSPGAYHAKSDATALLLSVFGQSLTLGVTHAQNASDPASAASGLGALVPVIGNQVAQNAQATADAPSEEHPQACGPVTLPPDFPVLDLATACSAASAVVNDQFPASTGEASVANIDVNGNAVLGQVAGPVNQPIGDLLNGLKPVFDAVNQQGVDAQSLLNQIISAITQDGDLVRITLGPSKSTSGADAATETAAASAQGAVIEVLPRDLLHLAPVLTIQVGAASNTITVDRNTGKATVAFLPSLVTATFADDIATALGLPDNAKTVSVAPGQSQCLGLPAPLDSCITVAGGSQSTDEEGVTHASAAGVSLHLLTGVQDGIRLDLASTSVEGVGALETARDAPPDLARTGGTVDTMLGGSLFALALAGLMLVRRSRVVAPAHSPAPRS